MVAPSAQPHPYPADTLISLLRSLAGSLVDSRTNHPPDTFDPQPYLAQSAPLFASLHGLNRAGLLAAKECRASSQDARLEMDAAHLRLQVRPTHSLLCLIKTALTLASLPAEPPL